MGLKKWEANRSKKKGGILNGTEKMGSKQIKKKGGILNGTEKMGRKGLQEKTVILQTWTGKKKLEANRSKKNPAS